MRRTERLPVDTFPFLAVLLCAMGSLILILLVMDRRARVAALQRGQEEARRAERERAEAIAARERDDDHKRDEFKVAYDRDKARLKARLDAEQAALDAEARGVQSRLAEIAGELRDEERLAGNLRTSLHDERSRLARQELALKAAREEAADLGGKITASDRARHKLAADTVRLEQIVRDLQEGRKRDALTYSVVPYKGKQGEKRRPLYVECGATGVVFHPDRLTLAEPSLEAIRDEVGRRAARLAEQRKQAGLKDERVSLLMLVRPEGVKRYYQVQSAIHGLPVEFGTEFVDEDWTLTIPEGGDPAEPSPEPVAAVKVPVPLTPTDAGVRLSPPQPTSQAQPLVILPREGAANTNPPAGIDLPPIGATYAPPEPPPARPPASLPDSIAAAKPGPDLGRAEPRGLPPLPGRADGSRSGEGEGERVVFVECRSDGVVVHPSSRSYSIDSLNHSPAHNPLYQAVVSRLSAPAVDPSRRALRFLVHPDGVRTFELACPAFNGVGVAKTRHDLQPGDDVSRLVGGH